jgi:3-oxoacyl-[acyl-carrier-protein] synthase-3
LDARRVTGAAAAIVGWGTAVPDGRVTNADLEARLDTSNDWIVERTGIRERRVAGPGETTASLAVEAAAHAIKRAGLVPADIDLLIIATVTPEQPIPHTGAYVGETLGLHCGSFDMNAACAGFVYELVVGSSMIQMGYDHVLVVGAETLSRIIDPEDRTTTVIFGDGAGAAVLAATKETPGLLAWDLGCDGSAAALLEVPAGGSRLPASAQTIADRGHYLKMAGQEVFRRAVRVVVESAGLTLARAGSFRTRPTPGSSTRPRVGSASNPIVRSSTSTATATRRRLRSHSRCSRPSTTAASATATSCCAPVSARG